MQNDQTVREDIRKRFEEYTEGDGRFTDPQQQLTAATLILAEELASLRVAVESEVRMHQAKHHLV